MWLGLRVIGGQAAGHRRVFTSARLLRLWLAADAQGVVVAVAGGLHGVAAGVTVEQRNRLNHFAAVFLDGLGALEQRVSAAAGIVNNGDFVSGYAAAGNLLAQAVVYAVVADVAAQQPAVCGLQDGAHGTRRGADAGCSSRCCGMDTAARLVIGWLALALLTSRRRILN